MPTTIDDYRATADQRARYLMEKFPLSANFWRLGHSFDTIVDYFITANANAADFGPVALARYTQSSGPAAPHPWYDDFGWWGIAALKASQRTDVFDELTEQFKAIALASWYAMDSKAPYVWDRADQDRFAELRPRFEGGVWNCDWYDNWSDLECKDDPHRCNPINLRACDGLCGFQNTVTNGLYLVLATRLVLNLPNAPDYLRPVKREYEFLWIWFNASGVDPLLKVVGPGKKVVRERVSAYYSGKKPYGYHEDTVWAGDQGLILGGLVDLMALKNFPWLDYNKLRDTAKSILAGSKEYLVDGGVLQPWRSSTGRPPGGDFWDYQTGIAVFMRYLLYAYQNNADLRSELQRPEWRQFIRDNADRIPSSPIPGGEVEGEPFADIAIVSATNDLATLVAAIVMLSPGQ